MMENDGTFHIGTQFYKMLKFHIIPINVIFFNKKFHEVPINSNIREKWQWIPILEFSSLYKVPKNSSKRQSVWKSSTQFQDCAKIDFSYLKISK